MIGDIYTEALLAAAAYADWSLLGTFRESEIKTELIKNRGFTEAQYNTFFDPQNINRLYDIYEGSSVGYVNDINGFSATIFENRLTGELTVSFRGTEPTFPFIDFLTDISALLGNPGGVLELFNQSNNIDDFLESNNLLSNGQLTQSVNFTGHSLGGYLSIMAAYKYSSSFGEAYTFNGLGLNPLENVWEDIKSIFDGRPLDETKVHNYFADKGFEGASNPLLSRPGGQERIFIEYDGLIDDAAFANHGIDKLVKSLSVYRVLALIDPTLDTDLGFDKIYNILDAASNISSQSLDTIITQLGDLLGSGLPANTGDVELFYQSAKLFLTNLGSTLTIEDLTTISAATLEQQVQTSIAYRYALVNLNPFLITGNDTIYNDHNLNGELKLFNPNTNEGTLTDQYLEDRAAFLQVFIESNIQDDTDINVDLGSKYNKADFIDLSNTNTPIEVSNNSSLLSGEKQYIFGSDRSDGRIFGSILDDHLYGGGGVDTLFGSGGNDYIEGNQGEDELIGGIGEDTLIGGKDNDVLWGGHFDGRDDNVKDILKGGSEFDTYLAGYGDEIEDSDGLGQILFQGALLRDGYREVSDPVGEYTSLYGEFKYVLNGASLTVSFVGDNDNSHSLTVNNFSAGQLGINLSEQTAPAFAEYTATDNNDYIFDFNNGLTIKRFDDPNGLPVHEATFTTPVQKISGKGGDDTIQIDADIPNIVIYGDSEGDAPGLDGDDFIEVDRTNVFNDTIPTDFTQGATIYGEAGNDFISGSQRNDFLHGQEDHDFIKGNDGADLIYGSTGNDFIEGGKNSVGLDVLNGGHNNDYVLGGAGADLIIGGEGNDRLYGDADSQGFFRNQTGTFYDGATQIFNIFNDPFSNFQAALTEVAEAEAGDDFLDGGLGDDFLYGGAGDDSLNGGADKDTLQGEAGNDFLKGGAGIDTLWGDKDPDSFDNDNKSIQGSTQTETFIFRQHVDAKDVIGDDILDGGTENDTLYGGQGNDTYRFGFGYGKDFVLDEAGSTDKIELGAGITPDNIELDVDDAKNNLIIKLKFNDGSFTGDEMTISNWYNGNEVESIQFASGLSWTSAFIENATGVTTDPDIIPEAYNSSLGIATENADVVPGTLSNNEIHLLRGNDRAAGGGGDDRLFGGEGNDELQGNNGDDILQGDEGNDHLFGQLGNDQLFGGEGDDFLYGNEGNDSLSGGTGDDNLSGGTGNDTYHYNRGDGDDLILDSAGTDKIVLGADITASDISVQKNGNDLVLLILENGNRTSDLITISDWFNASNQIETVQFNDGGVWDVAAIQALLPDDQTLENGITTIGSDKASIYRFQPSADMTAGFNITLNDSGGIDTLLFEQASLTIPGSGTFYATSVFDGYSRDGNDLVLNVSVNSNIGTIPNSSGQVRITNYYSQTGFIETIEFPSGILNNPNFAPVLNDSAQDQIILSDTLYSYQLAANSFTNDALDMLNIKATLTDGSALPAWLSFDANTLTFSGTPTVADSEIIDINVTATDSANQSVTLDFNLNVGNVNLAPEVANAIDDQVSRSQRAFNFQIPTDIFSDVNLNETLTFSATLSDGSDLPAWLSFDDVTGTFSGTPADVDIGSVDVVVTATDSGGLTASDTFSLSTNVFNSIPVANADSASVFFEAPSETTPSEFLVNTETAGDQSNPAIAKLSDGGFVTVWSTEQYDPINDITVEAIAGQRFGVSGNKVGSEFDVAQLNSEFALEDIHITELNNGGFVVVWRDRDNPNATDSFAIVGQTFDANMQKVGGEFIVSASQENEQSPSIAATDTGFVVTWSSKDVPFDNQFDYRVLAQRYDNSGSTLGSQITVSNDTGTSRNQPDVASSPDGGFIVVWRDFTGGSINGGAGQRFDANGARIGSEFSVGISDELDSPNNPKVTVLDDGSFIVIANDSDGFQSVADRFNANGGYIESFVVSNPDPDDPISDHAITSLNDGSFLVTWSSGGIEAARVDASGEITRFRVSEQVSSSFRRSDVVELDDGSLAIVWDSDIQPGDSNFSIVGKVFPAATTPVYLIDVLANDTDADPDDDPSNFTLDSATVQGDKGSVTIENNQIRFDPGIDFNDLRAGDIATVTIDYTMSDDSGESSSSTLTLNLRGSLSQIESDLSGVTRLIPGGSSLSDAGDINGDGYADFIVGDENNTAAYVIFGQGAELESEIDLTTLDGSNGFVVEAAESVSSVSSAGDINGDGFDDIIIGDPSATLNDYDYSGGAFVVYGKSDGFSSSINFEDLDGSNGFQTTGTTSYGEFGKSVSNAGDINGDGIDDVIIGAPNSNNYYGETFVLFGNSNGFDAVFDSQSLDGTNGFRIEGSDDNRNSGAAVSNIGDFNGDGFDDIIITKADEDSPAEAFVIYGKKTGFDDTIELESLDEVSGLRITGFGYNEDGLSIGNAGDVNGDGIDDIIIGNSEYNDGAGASYVIFGDNNIDATFDIEDLDGSNGFRIDGVNEDDRSGSSVSTAGDINGDGFDDIIIGAPRTMVNGFYEVGASYVIFGDDNGFNSTFDLASIDGNNGLRLLGLDQYHYSGASVSAAGDINGDGFDDLIVSSPYANNYYGESYIIYGKDYQNEVDVLGSSGDDIIDVVENDQTIFTLDGDDIINVGDVEKVSIATGRGSNTINLSAGGNVTRSITLRSSRGSRNNVRIGSSSSPVTRTLNGRYIIPMPSINGTNGTNTAFDIYTGKSVSTSSIKVRRGSLIIDIDDGFIELHFTDVNTNNLSTVEDLFERITFNDSFTLTYQDILELGFDFDGTDADDVLFGTEIIDRINGFDGNDVLDGGKGNDELDGGAGNDNLSGGKGNDILIGGEGVDQLSGGAGDDSYIINADHGSAIINDIEGVDQIVFGAGISVFDISVSDSYQDLLISLNANDQITILNWFDSDSNKIERFVFTENNLLILTASDIEALIGGGSINLPPMLDKPISDLAIDEADLFNFDIPADTFSDSNIGDTLNYSAALSNGDPLPDWLSFDAVTQSFSGTPGDEDVGTLSISVTVIDNNGLSVSDTFSLTINEIDNVNNSPILQGSGIADQVTDEDLSFSFTVPVDTFIDPDAGDTLIYSATLADDSALPSWLSFGAATQTFSGTPDNNDVDSVDVKVTATDTGGLSVSDAFSLTINNVNDAPVLANAITDQSSDEDAPFSFTVPSNTFSDDDAIHGDTLSYSATLADDSALPSWLSFDATTQTFSGTPDNNNVGSVDVKVTATDTGGLSVSDEFSLTVNNVNDNPVLANAITDQSSDEDQAFTFTIPANTFADDDSIHGDVLSYSATLADDSALPSWLSFDATTQTFSGTPDNNDVGAIDVKVTATDTGGLSVSDEISLSINNVNDNPVLANAITDQNSDEDAPFSFTVPTNTFSDDDAIHGDTLSYSATLADDSALPSWLSFDAATQTFSGTPDNNDVGSVDVKVTATDTGGLSVSDEFSLTINNVNDNPVLANAISDQSTDEDQAFSFTVPSNTFVDDDAIHGDSLTYSATLADDSALPSWLSFDAATQTFSSTPDNNDVGSVDVKVTATDTGGLSVSDEFSLTINNVNDNPILENAITDQSSDEDQAFSFTVPSNTFADDDVIHGDVLALTATLADGSALPSWLSFDATTQTFSGTPDNNDVGNVDVKVTATDTGGLSVSDEFSLTINNVNDNPVLANAISDQSTDEDAPFSFTVPANTFSDDDAIHGDVLSYSATLSDDSELPSWLSFDAATQTFSGTPDNNDVGNVDVKVTATDNGGLSVSDEFSVVINNVNDAPILANAITDQSSDEDAPFSFTVPSNTFADDDAIHGDTITYSASLSDDTALPSWLSFDAATQTFSGTPDNNDVGNVDVKVTATDTGGLSVSDEFSVVINNVNDAPELTNPIDDQAINEGEQFSYQLPADTFSDDDLIHGDVLALTATLADGSVLPSWLSFDATTQTFSGQVPFDASGLLELQVTATDTGGLSISDTFSLDITNVINGNDRPNYLVGTNEKDIINGFGRSDWLFGKGGNDILNGHGGNDDLWGGEGNDTLNGGSGNDWLFGNQGNDVLNGGTGNDHLREWYGNNILNGDDGHDWLQGGLGDDQLNGGAGNDHLHDWYGNNILDGGEGRDHLKGGYGNDHLLGGEGNDWLEDWYGNNTLDGGSGHDHIEGGYDDDQLFGGEGDDWLKDWSGNNTLDGGSGNDTLQGGYDDDQLLGGDGNDWLKDWSGNNTLDGGAGNDDLLSGYGNDQLEGGDGNDWLSSDGGNDTLHGGAGDDRIKGGRGDDTYLFNRDDDLDVINEQQGEDTLRFGESIEEDDLWFWRDHKDLNIGIIGTDDKVTIEDWYQHSHHHYGWGYGWGWHGHSDNRIERFELSDGTALLENQVQQIVDAMSVFDVPNSGTLDVPQTLQDDVQSVITTAWQAA
jgi:Ca2+-binding RTX toxin-like protein